MAARDMSGRTSTGPTPLPPDSGASVKCEQLCDGITVSCGYRLQSEVLFAGFAEADRCVVVS